MIAKCVKVMSKTVTLQPFFLIRRELLIYGTAQKVNNLQNTRRVKKKKEACNARQQDLDKLTIKEGKLVKEGSPLSVAGVGWLS